MAQHSKELSAMEMIPWYGIFFSCLNECVLCVWRFMLVEQDVI